MRPFTVALTASLAGCAADPGAQLLRLTLWSVERDAGCWYPDTAPPPNQAEDTSDVGESVTAILYDLGDDAYVFDGFELALSGAATDDGYTFSGESVDVSWTSPDGTGDRYTTTSSDRVDLVVDGPHVDGGFTAVTTYACDGAGCPTPAVPSCTQTGQFDGVILPDAAFTHEL